MPPAVPDESEVESVVDEVSTPKAETPAKTEDVAADATMKDEGQEDEEENPDEEELYVVEAILDHRSDFEDGQMRYHVKWKGYEKKADRTWETEENLEGAREILEAYWKKLGAKPVAGGKSATKKRGRQSTGSTNAKTPDTSKRPRMSKKLGRKSNGTQEQDTSPAPLTGYTDVGDDDWKPPNPKDGAWDPLVQSVDTVVRENTDGELWGYLIWNEKNSDGRFYRSKAKLPTVYKACPQRMLHFYEKHLVFSTNTADSAAEEKGAE